MLFTSPTPVRPAPACGVDEDEDMATREYKPGDSVDHSGVYRVAHAANHTPEHEATLLYGKRFPPCNRCGQQARFYPVRLAHHIEGNEHFDQVPY
jgi:hypothetical protein